MTETRKLRLQLRKVKAQERIAESVPFQCELWGIAPGRRNHKIAHVSNSGGGGCHDWSWDDRSDYQRLLDAVRYAKNRPLDPSKLLDWSLLTYHTWLAGLMKETLPEPHPLADAIEVADAVVDQLLLFNQLNFKTHLYFAPEGGIDIKQVKMPATEMMVTWARNQISDDHPGAVILNDLGPAYLPLPPE